MDRPSRIALVSPLPLDAGGAELALADLGAALTRLGAEITFVTPVADASTTVDLAALRSVEAAIVQQPEVAGWAPSLAADLLAAGVRVYQWWHWRRSHIVPGAIPLYCSSTCRAGAPGAIVHPLAAEIPQRGQGTVLGLEDAVFIPSLAPHKGGAQALRIAAALPEIPFVALRPALAGAPLVPHNLPNVKVLPPVNHAVFLSYVAMARACLLPTWSETCGRALWEAAVFDTPIVAPAVLGLVETLGADGLVALDAPDVEWIARVHSAYYTSGGLHGGEVARRLYAQTEVERAAMLEDVRQHRKTP